MYDAEDNKKRKIWSIVRMSLIGLYLIPITMHFLSISFGFKEPANLQGSEVLVFAIVIGFSLAAVLAVNSYFRVESIVTMGMFFALTLTPLVAITVFLGSLLMRTKTSIHIIAVAAITMYSVAISYSKGVYFDIEILQSHTTIKVAVVVVAMLVSGVFLNKDSRYAKARVQRKEDAARIKEDQKALKDEEKRKELAREESIRLEKAKEAERLRRREDNKTEPNPEEGLF